MGLSPKVVSFVRDTADSLSGAARRRYMARALAQLALSQRQAERTFGWSRDTTRKVHVKPAPASPAATPPPAAAASRRSSTCPICSMTSWAIAQDHCQTDPTFETTRLYCRLTAAEVRRQLIQRKGYTDVQLPSRQTIGAKLNALGFRLLKVAKCRPQKSTADRGHLRQRQGGARAGRGRGADAAPLPGQQGPRSHRSLPPRRPEPDRYHGGRSRLQAGRGADAVPGSSSR